MKDRTKLLSRRNLLLGASMAVLAPYVLTRGSKARAAAPLNFLTYGGLYADAQEEAILSPFSKETGIEVQTSAGRDAVSALITDSKLDEPTYDLVVLSDVELHTVLRQGELLAEIDTSALTNIGSVFETSKALPYSVGVSLNPWGLLYNNERAAKPSGWGSLWSYAQPERTALQKPAAGSARLFNLFAAAIAGGGKWSDVDDVGFKMINQLKSKGTQVTDLGTSLSMFQSGDVDLLPMYNNEAYSMAKEGFPADFVFPADGIFVFGVWLGMPRNLPPARKAATEKLIDAFLDPAAQVRMSTAVYDGPTNKTAKIPADLAAKIITSDRLSQSVQLDWDYIVDNQDRWVDRWNRGN